MTREGLRSPWQDFVIFGDFPFYLFCFSIIYSSSKQRIRSYGLGVAEMMLRVAAGITARR